MAKLTVSTREIGSVRVFDLIGEPTEESVQEVAWRIQRNIERHRLQRIILNLQLLSSLGPLGLRKLLAACIRPQKSLIFGASADIRSFLESTYVPRNVRICNSEKEVAEDLGPFLLEKDGDTGFPKEGPFMRPDSLGYQVEKRRSKRMRVALPIDLKIQLPTGSELLTRAIATNISEGGVFAEYLDLEATEKIEGLDVSQGLPAAIVIFPSTNFPEEYRLKGKLIRKQLNKKQLGVAVEFIGEDAAA